MNNDVKSVAKWLIVLPLLGVLLVACHDKTPPPWPWWTEKDRSSAAAELDRWRDTISTRQFIEGGVEPLVDSLPVILSRDSSSATGDSLIRIRRLLGFGLALADAARRDSMLFGVTVDSLPSDTFPTDTFCYVIAWDSAMNRFSTTQFDEYWVIKYHAIANVDTTVTPPETTWTYKLDSLAPPPRLVTGETKEEQKDVPMKVRRYVYLRKIAGAYQFRRMSGYAVYIPTTSDAPSISFISLRYQGKVDTFRLNAQLSQKGIYNLRDRDSLYSVKAGESVQVRVQTSKPGLRNDQYYYILRIGGTRTAVVRDSLPATLTAVFPQPGIRHLVVEVIPQSNLFYPASDFRATVWSLPVLVKE